MNLGRHKAKGAHPDRKAKTSTVDQVEVDGPHKWNITTAGKADEGCSKGWPPVVLVSMPLDPGLFYAKDCVEAVCAPVSPH